MHVFEYLVTDLLEGYAFCAFEEFENFSIVGVVHLPTISVSYSILGEPRRQSTDIGASKRSDSVYAQRRFAPVPARRCAYDSQCVAGRVDLRKCFAEPG